MYELAKHPERCILVGFTGRSSRWSIEDNLSELSDLAHTAGADVIETFLQEKTTPDSAFFIGKGKADEISAYILENKIDLVIFDDELSPAQIRNLENLFLVKVIDRSGLILDIFADHARTKQAKTQVELAQLEYFLPRLTRHWSHLSRQVGGIGTKGPGETQLETDKRLVRLRITQLKQLLKRIEKQKEAQRKKSEALLRISLVGYTNAGKSTVMNALTESDVLVEDKIFATLDTTVRRLYLDEGITVLLSDTVGFIRKLPHELIASFQTTLAQTYESDVILMVVDISDEAYAEKIEVVEETLSRLNISGKPTILLMNKVDKVKDSNVVKVIKRAYPQAIFISARKKYRLDHVKWAILEIVKDFFIEISINVNYGEYHHLGNKFSRLLQIYSHEYFEDHINLKLRFPRAAHKEVFSLLADLNSEPQIISERI